MNFPTILFYISSFFLVFSSCIVIVIGKPIIALLFLISSFVNASILWMLLGAEFLSLLLLIIYVGAVLVLFLFAIMLLDQKYKDREFFGSFIRSYKPTILLIMSIIFIEILFILFNFYIYKEHNIHNVESFISTADIGKIMYTDYIFAVELGAIILFVGIIAAISLTVRKNRNNVKYNDINEAVNTKAKDRLTIIK